LYKKHYNDKADKTSIPTALSQLTADSTHRTVTDTEKSTWNNKQDTFSTKHIYLALKSGFMFIAIGSGIYNTFF
jgi:hypothetical protein